MSYIIFKTSDKIPITTFKQEKCPKNKSINETKGNRSRSKSPKGRAKSPSKTRKGRAKSPPKKRGKSPAKKENYRHTAERLRIRRERRERSRSR
jgi:hypothetical protein